MAEKEIIEIRMHSMIFAYVYCVLLTVVFAFADFFAHSLQYGTDGRTILYYWPAPYAWVWNYGGLGYPTGGFTMSIIATLLTIIGISKLLPRKYRFNHAEIAFIMATVIMSITIASRCGWGWRLGGCASQHLFRYEARGEIMLKYLSPMLYPLDKDVLKGQMYGGVPVPWNAWMIPIITQLAIFLSLRLFFFFLGLLIQEQFIDIEALPFPVTTLVQSAVIDLTHGRGIAQQSGSKKIFLISLVLGLLWWVYQGTQIWYPALGKPIMPYLDLTPYGFFNGPLFFAFEPLIFAFAMILPLDVTITAPIIYIIMYLIVGPMLMSVGLLAAPGPGREASAAKGCFIDHGAGAPTSPLVGGYSAFYLGVLYCLAIIPFIRYRGRLLDSIKMAIKGGSREGDIFSPRTMWGGFVLFGLVTIALWSVIGIPVYATIPLLFMISIWFIGFARANSAAGVLFLPISALWGYVPEVHNYWYLQALGWVPTETDWQKDVVYDFTFFGVETTSNCDAAGFQGHNNLYWNLSSYKLASLTKAEGKKIALAVLFGTLIPVIIMTPLGIWLNYTYGWFDRSVYNFSRNLHDCYRTVTNGGLGLGGRPMPNMNPQTFASGVVGFVIVMLMMFARARIGGIFNFLSPVAFMLVWLDDNIFWLPCLIISIVRLIVYRVGGTRLYMEKFYPIALGLIVSTAIAWFVCLPIVLLRGLGYRWW